MCSVVTLFLIGVIPVKITHVYSQSELLWGAKGSGRPPKISRLIPKMHRIEPPIPGTSDDSRGSTKLYDRDLNACMLIQLIYMFIDKMNFIIVIIFEGKQIIFFYQTLKLALVKKSCKNL